MAIASWDWTKSNGSATAAQTQTAYTALTSNGKLSDFSYLVWNDLINKVKECVDGAGVSWGEKTGVDGAAGASYSAALMTATDKTLTAARFNAFRGNVGARVSTGVQPVSSGDPVVGSSFIAVINSLNTWINNINNA